MAYVLDNKYPFLLQSSFSIIKIKALMTSKLIIVLSASLLLSACSVKSYNKKPPQNAPSTDAAIKLAEAANSVSRSLIELAKIEKESKTQPRQAVGMFK